MIKDDRLRNRFKRFCQEIKIRGYSNKTQQAYLFHIEKFLNFCKKPALQVTSKDIKNYLEHLIDTNKSRSTVRLAWNSLNFYFTNYLGKRVMKKINLPKNDNKTIVPLTKDEISKLISVIRNKKHRLLVEFMYASGLRVSEVVKFKIKDILVEEGLAIVRSGKGKKDRKVILSNIFLSDFKDELSKKGLNDYLFEGREGHLTVRSVQKIVASAAKKTGIKKNVHPHLLRHSFATHLLDNNTDIKYIQKVLGHSSIKTTERYIFVSDKDLKKVKSPFDTLN